MAAVMNFGGNCNTRPGFTAPRLSLPIDGLLQARLAVAAVQSRLNWLCRNRGSVALNAGLKALGRRTRR
jgi:hypothetical protein